MNLCIFNVQWGDTRSYPTLGTFCPTLSISDLPWPSQPNTVQIGIRYYSYSNEYTFKKTFSIWQCFLVPFINIHNWEGLSDFLLICLHAAIISEGLQSRPVNYKVAHRCCHMKYPERLHEVNS